jgi:prepilin-type N-terminal cleavage/methylation domain-containing protein/prepilin-type processing-associated H-X9-DG protein
MKEELLPDDFVSSLLMQDELLRSEKFEPHRRELLERLEAAGQRERKARRGTITAGVAGAAIFAVLIGIAMLPSSQAWSDPLIYLVATTVILTPVTILILLGIYLFRYRAEVARAKKELRRETLLEIPRQITELRKEIEELRARVGKPGEKGFTLMEMLVVAGVLGILTSMMFPALSSARAKGRAVTCTNNLRQQAQALAMYEGDYHYLPGSGDPVILLNTAPWAMVDSNSWTSKLTYYLSGATAMFDCPEFRDSYQRNVNLSMDEYGYNAGGGAGLNIRSSELGLGYGSSNYVMEASVASPAEMIALGDLRPPKSVWLNYITPWRKGGLGDVDSVIPARHSAGSNMSFVDGHLEHRKREQWIGETDLARARWNRDHVAHPEMW